MTPRDEQFDGVRPPLATRAAPPCPRRLSRKAIALLTGGGAFAVAGALAWSLGAGRGAHGPQESVAIAPRADAEALRDAPKDYRDVAEKMAATMPPPAPADADPPAAETGAPDPQTVDLVAAEAERRRQQRDSARASQLFAGSGTGSAAARGAATEPRPPEAGAPQHPPGPAPAQDGQPRLAPPPGPHVLLAGSTIAGALVTGLHSDLPGQVIAQVTEDVFDSVTGRTRLIPQGARLLGTYESKVAFGQDRVLVVWNRLIYPDGRSIDLGSMRATDGSGNAGLSDRVDQHWGRIIKAGIVATLFGVGTELANSGDNDAIADAIRDSSGQTIDRAGDRIVERELEVRPTIMVRPGARIRVLISRDLTLDPA